MARIECFVLVFLVIGAVEVTGLRRGELINMTMPKTIDYKALVPAIVTFGDSTVDVGNNNYLLTLAKSNFAPNGRQFEAGTATGRFCDGKTTIDFITERFGFPLGLPYLAPNAHGNAILTGINFASSASGWYDATATTFDIPLLKEILEAVSDEQYAELHKNVMLARKHFIWHSPAHEHDAFHTVMYELWKRRHIVRRPASQ